jgi:hypothetical protein
MSAKNPTCDYGHRAPKVTRLPLGDGTELVLCREHWLAELRSRSTPRLDGLTDEPELTILGQLAKIADPKTRGRRKWQKLVKRLAEEMGPMGPQTDDEMTCDHGHAANELRFFLTMREVALCRAHCVQEMAVLRDWNEQGASRGDKARFPISKWSDGALYDWPGGSK